MNYIQHLNKIFREFALHDDLRPYHISLYLALFMAWNEKIFPKEIFFYRGEMMKRSKIKTPSQYHKAIKDLHNWNFIFYTPSKNPITGSSVTFIPSDKRNALNGIEKKSTFRPEKLKEDGEEPKEAFGKQDHSHEEQRDSKFIHVAPVKYQDRANKDQVPSQEAHVASNKGHAPYINKLENNKTFIYLREKVVIDYFFSQRWPKLQALKFFHHYQAIGWKKGGTTPITDWKAAAKSWILRGTEFKNLKISPGEMKNQDNLKTTKAKHYDKPL